jgi:hypothetical protein
MFTVPFLDAGPIEAPAHRRRDSVCGERGCRQGPGKVVR